MSVPSPYLTVPTLVNDSVSFNGVTLGNGTCYGLTGIEGLGKPAVRSGNTVRPRFPGAYVGANYLNTRKPTLTLDVGPTGSGYGAYPTLGKALQALAAAISTEGTSEYPMWVQMPGLPLVCIQARVIQGGDFKYDITADRGLVRNLPIGFEATDPYLYAAPTTNATISLPAPAGGVSFPLSFPLSFGGGATGNQITAVNNGNVNCWPTLVFTGPCLNPSLANQSIAGTPTLTLNMQLNTGDQIVADCATGTLVLYPAGSTIGSPQPQILQAGATFPAIAPGSNILAFNSQDTTPAAGTVSVWYASTWDALL